MFTDKKGERCEKYYAIVQQDRAGYFMWLRERKPEFAKQATVVKVLEGEDSVTVEQEARALLDALRHDIVPHS